METGKRSVTRAWGAEQTEHRDFWEKETILCDILLVDTRHCMFPDPQKCPPPRVTPNVYDGQCRFMDYDPWWGTLTVWPAVHVWGQRLDRTLRTFCSVLL